jgi:hypothetical protein
MMRPRLLNTDPEAKDSRFGFLFNEEGYRDKELEAYGAGELTCTLRKGHGIDVVLYDVKPNVSYI